MIQYDTIEEAVGVTRVEVIDNSGRAYVNYRAGHVEISYQDGGRTLKVFISNSNGETTHGKSQE
jgi:hypothetical protein